MPDSFYRDNGDIMTTYQTSPSMSVGLVGFGIMGRPMAHRLVHAGHRVTVVDADADAAARATEFGCPIAPTPAAVAAQTSVVVLSLPGPDHVRRVVHGAADCLLDGAPEGSIIIDTSTVDPQTSRDNAALATEKGIGYLDCPILGRPSNVGSWTIPVGGERRQLDQVRPILNSFASNVVHLGPVGQGNTIKLLNNLMFGAINSITAEVFALSDHVGIDRRVLFETIAGSGAATVSNLFKELGTKIVDDDFSPNFTVDNLVKDIGLGIELASLAGVRLHFSEAGQSLNRVAQEMGFGPEDSAAVVKSFDQSTISQAETKP